MDMFYGILIGLVVALIIFLAMTIRHNSLKKSSEKELARIKALLTDRMELESDGLSKLKGELETLRKENENLRISLQTYSNKPGRKELQRLNVYQTAVDRLIINSPGFGPAWQSALKESEEEFQKTFFGSVPFIKKLIPIKSDAKMIEDESND